MGGSRKLAGALTRSLRVDRRLLDHDFMPAWTAATPTASEFASMRAPASKVKVPWSYFCENGNRSGILTVAAGATPGRPRNLAPAVELRRVVQRQRRCRTCPTQDVGEVATVRAQTLGEDWLTYVPPTYPVLEPLSGSLADGSRGPRVAAGVLLWTLASPPPWTISRTLSLPRSTVRSTGRLRRANVGDEEIRVIRQQTSGRTLICL